MSKPSFVHFCTAKYGLENTGRTSFSDVGPARKAWNELLDRVRKTGQPEWVAIYIPNQAKKYRDEKDLPPLDDEQIQKISGLVEVPLPPKPMIWNDFGFDRWPLGLPIERKWVLDKPISVADYLPKEKRGSFNATMRQSSLFEIKGTEIEAEIIKQIKSGQFSDAPIRKPEG